MTHIRCEVALMSNSFVKEKRTAHLLLLSVSLFSSVTLADQHTHTHLCTHAQTARDAIAPLLSVGRDD